MIEFEQALDIILKNTTVLSKEKIPVEKSIGRILDEDIFSDINMPPFNKSAVDGYAVIAKDTVSVAYKPVKLKCIGIIQAGENFCKKLRLGECVKIMTGAPLPENSDSVIMFEDTKKSGQYVELKKSVKKNENVCIKGEDIKKGMKILSKGKEISVSDIGLIATVGKSFVEVIKKPQVSVLNTGGEIVSPGNKLSKNKIFNANGPMLLSLLESDNIKPSFLGIVKDKPEQLKKAFTVGLNSDIFLVSGGCSVGDYDIVPNILKSLGVKNIFHKVNIKPGKPILFGKRGKTIVFGIPGNPISNFLSYFLFVQPAIYKMMGYKIIGPKFKTGIIKKTFYQKPGRKHFIPVKISKKNTNYFLIPIPSHGSADIVSLSKADGFMVAEKNISIIRKNSEVEFITWKKNYE